MTNFINIISASKSFENFENDFMSKGIAISILDCINVSLNKNDLCFNLLVELTELKSGKKLIKEKEMQAKVGHKTPSGYLSTKKIGVQIEDLENLTQEESIQVLALETDAICQKFDPFFAENNAKRRNASAWASIARNHMQEDCR